MIRSAYEKLFVAFYGWSLKYDGGKGEPNAFYSIIFLTMAQLLNAMSIVVTIDLVAPPSLLSFVDGLSKGWAMTFVAAVAASQYFYFIHGDRYRKLIATYAGNIEQLRSRRHWKVGAYLACSFAILATLALVDTAKRH